LQEYKKKLKKHRFGVSRRRFLTLGTISAAGIWAGCSNQLFARAVREVVADTRRAIGLANATPSPDNWDPNAITAAWLGHATVLINFQGLTILTDPALMTRVGANTAFGTVGAKRLVKPALTARELPPIDLVVLSHAHMDHMDFATLNRLPGRPHAVTARGTDDLLAGTRLQKPRALGWGESTRIETQNGSVSVEAFEVRHWGARWRWDTFRGYNGYVLEREGRRIIFGGDTAYTDSFATLRRRQEYEFAIMPIGAYHPWVESHCNPEEAVSMAEDAGAGRILPIHFRTFPLGREARHEPLDRLEEALPADRIGWRHIGETFVA
jgi:L-ascorbate metabolism protein UlaG (beta-lactamase superfamily)